MADPADPRGARRSRLALVPLVISILAVAGAAIAIGISGGASEPPGGAPGASVQPGGAGAAPASGSPAATTGPASGRPTVFSGQPPRLGWIAAVDGSRALTLITPGGDEIVLSGRDQTTVGFPAFSPDGTRLAAIFATDGVTTIDVFALDAAAGGAGPPRPIYRSSAQAAFYVSWMPGGRDVSFLANDEDVVVLRVAAADRATPLDETDSASLVRRGAPLYFDWIDDERALLHVGVGAGAFLGRVRRDGTPDGGVLTRPAGFRVAQVAPGGRFVSWVRTTGTRSEVVVARDDGSAERSMPVFGLAAAVFSPVENRLAAIGAVVPDQTDLGFPLGPLRTLDAESGDSRTLVDGAVVAFFWAPDGKTIAALRLQASSGTTARALNPLGAASPSPVPSEVHLLFVDAASGAVRSDRIVRPGPRLVSELLPYFDQYALSHRLWAPDSSSFLLPVVSPGESLEVVALPADGSDSPFSIAGSAAFWSP